MGERTVRVSVRGLHPGLKAERVLSARALFRRPAQLLPERGRHCSSQRPNGGGGGGNVAEPRSGKKLRATDVLAGSDRRGGPRSQTHAAALGLTFMLRRKSSPRTRLRENVGRATLGTRCRH